MTPDQLDPIIAGSQNQLRTTFGYGDPNRKGWNAAFSSVYDFRQARLLDPDWWRLCYILLNSMQQEDNRKVLDYAYQLRLALVGNSGLSDESFKDVQAQAKETFFDILGNLRPWEGITGEARKNNEIADLRKQYIERFGDPATPEFQARLKRSLDEMERRRNETAKEISEEDKIRQRIQEHNQKLEERRKEAIKQRTRRGKS